jgi:hypothetical protein
VLRRPFQEGIDSHRDSHKVGAAVTQGGISQARKLAGVALARIIGVKAAARTMGVDPRSISSWLAANAGADADEQAWQAAEQLAQERLLTGLATGDAKSIAAWATAAGVSSRNRRYATLIRRRDQRRAEQDEGGKPANDQQAAIHAAVEALPDEITDWLRDYIELQRDLDKIRERVGAEQPDEGDDPDMLEWIASLAASTAEGREAVTDRYIAEAVELTKGWKIVRKGSSAAPYHQVLDANSDPYNIFGSVTPPEFAHLPVGDEPPASPLPQPTPTPPGPSQRGPAPSRPVNVGLRVVTEAEQNEFDDQRHLWHRVDS